MLSRFGLRFRMAASYVVVSAAAVVVVEAVLLAILVPRMRSANDSVLEARQRVAQAEVSNTESKVKGLALQTAATAGSAAGFTASTRPGMTDSAMLAYAAEHGFTSDSGSKADGGTPSPAPESDRSSAAVKALATVDGRVVADVGMGADHLPAGAVGRSARGGTTVVNGLEVSWATHPVEIIDSSGTGRRVIGIAYGQMPSRPPDDGLKSESAESAESTRAADIGSLLAPGAIVLVLLLPVGALFGLFSTGRLIRRIRRLAQGTTAMADGDLRSRIPVSGGDEVGRLEQAFNSMAERLEAAVLAERVAAGAVARRAERTRIARELHDSISQDLFSASLLAGGLRKALPGGSGLRHQASSMEHALERMMREMRAMLLELRPVALEDAGLGAALDDLCRAYEVRLGISISADVGALRLEPQVEHAVLRVVQEAVGNAVRHGEPERIELRVTESEGQVMVVVRDDGRGFDPQRVAGRHGMGLELMRERVGELGGTFEVASAPEQGTTVRVLLPGGAG